MSANMHHKLCRFDLDGIRETIQEAVTFEGKVSFIINLRQGLHHFLEVDQTKTGKQMLIRGIIVIMYMEGIEAIAQYTYGILWLSADNGGVADVKVCHNVIIIQGVNIAAEFLCP